MEVGSRRHDDVNVGSRRQACPQAFVVEAVDTRDGGAFVIASQEEEVLVELHLRVVEWDGEDNDVRGREEEVLVDGR